MANILLISTFLIGVAVSLLISDFKQYQSERNDINKAKQLSEQNRAIGNVINIENHSSGLKLNSNLSNSQLLHTKPISYRISEFKEGSKEQDIANRYAEAAKIVLKDNPNLDINCSLISNTNLITFDECLTVHDKEYDFFHKTDDGSLAYNLTNENVKKYAIQIEANKYNLKTEEIDNNNKIILDKRFVDPNNTFLNKKNSDLVEKNLNTIKNHLLNKNYLLASAGLYNIKKNNYQQIPLISNLYSQLLEEIEVLTKNSLPGTYEHDLRLKIQAEFLKLTKVSNIMETIKHNNNLLANDFIESIVSSYSVIENNEKILTKDIESLPSKNDFIMQLSKFKS